MAADAIFSFAPTSSEVVDISAADYTFTSKSIVAIHNATSAGGTVVAQLFNDATVRTWFIPAGGYIHGAFKKVQKTSTTLTAAGAMVGVTCVPSAPAGA